MIDAPVYRFQHFELRPNRHQLVVAGRQILLGSRALDVLAALASRAGEMITKQELLDRVWPHAAVQEANLTVQISTLRKELGPDVIATIPGRGYRLIAERSGDDQPPADPAHPPIAGPGPAPQAPSKLRTNLAGWTRPLLGRDADLSAVRALLVQHRIVTIAGAGGMGKTLLARHVLLDPPGDFRHGVCWVELTATTDPAALPATVAAALGLELGGGDAMAQLAARVSPLEMLLALDNAEHLLADVAALAQRLNDVAPGVRILVTSQAPLRVAPESVYRLQPLAVPPASLALDSAMHFGAVALLVERARAADARFVLTDEAVPLLVEICRALDGVPLALELAAARAPMLGLPQLVQSLRERLRLLNVNRDRWAPVRQQTLRQAHEWSYRLLGQPEQEAFRRLGVLAGSASLATIQALASNGSAQPADAWAALDSLSILADRSLIVLLPAPDDAHPDAVASPRYRLLESSRLFALEQLQATDELAGAQRVHARRMADVCDAAWDVRWSGEIGMKAWADAIKPDLDDAFEAYTWAAGNGEPALAVRIARTLLYALPVSQQRQHGLLAECCETFAGDSGLLPAQRVQAWLAVCSNWIDRNGSRAAAASESAVALARQHLADGGDAFWLYFALSQRAALHARHSEAAPARQAIAEMRAVAEASGGQSHWPPHRLLAGASAEGYAACAAGDMQAALAFGRKRLALQQAAGGNVFLSLSNLMDAEIAAGEAAAAVQTGLHLVQLVEGSRDEHSLTAGRLNLTAAWLAVGEPAQARELAQASWPAACRFRQQAFWADYLALLACCEARPRAAARLAGYSEQAYARNGSARDHNEAVAFDSAVSLARAALGDADFDRLAAAGRGMDDDDAGRCAFTLNDPA